MEAYLATEPTEVMRKHGKSFYFASQVFSHEQFENIALLYAFCRYVDDLADEFEPTHSLELVTDLKSQVEKGQYQDDVKDMITTILQKGVKKEYLLELIDGALFDLKNGEIHTKKDLLVYCYKVAGVVGLMMCPLLGVTNEKALGHAIDLGIGMQLTNITRDFYEDAHNNRLYIPEEMMKTNGVSMDQIKSKNCGDNIRSITKMMLDTADYYYFSSREGLAFIPFRPRLAILIASEVYRAIGSKIRKNNYNSIQGRTYLNLFEKLIVTLWSFRLLLTPMFWSTKEHKPELHQMIQHLPGTNQGEVL